MSLALSVYLWVPALATNISMQFPGPSVKIQGWVAKVLTV